MKLAFFILLCLVTLVSCAPGPAAFQFYVVIKPGEAERLFATITSLAKENGLELAGRRVTSDTGNVTQIVEGRGNGVRFWLQNATSSAREDPNICGIHHEPYADPAQFIVFTTPRFGFGSSSAHAAAVDLGEKMFSQLQKLGFNVRRKPAVCGAAVHLQ